MDYENRVIQYEAALNCSMDAWFAARPHIERNKESEFIYEGAFRMAWDARTDAISQEGYPA